MSWEPVPASADVLVHQEDDERFFLSLGLTRSERFVIIHAASKTTSEAHWVDAAEPRRANGRRSSCPGRQASSTTLTTTGADG